MGHIYWDNGKENGNYYNGIYRGILIYGLYILGSWKRKWKLLYYNRVYIGAICTHVKSLVRSKATSPIGSGEAVHFCGHFGSKALFPCCTHQRRQRAATEILLWGVGLRPQNVDHCLLRMVSWVSMLTGTTRWLKQAFAAVHQARTLGCLYIEAANPFRSTLHPDDTSQTPLPASCTNF